MDYANSEEVIWKEQLIHGRLFRVCNEGYITHKNKKNGRVIYHCSRKTITINGKKYSKARVIAHVFLNIDIDDKNYTVFHNNTNLPELDWVGNLLIVNKIEIKEIKK